MPETRMQTAPASPRPQTAQWAIALLLAFIAGLLWSRGPGGGGAAALAQNAPLVGARGVYAFTGQLDRNRFGLFMLDIEQGTIWCYELDNVAGVRKLRLTAARSWVYDRYLRDFNCEEPTYKQVQELVAQQRAMPQPKTGVAGDGGDQDSLPLTEEDSPDGP
jgi:hypothetical protein